VSPERELLKETVVNRPEASKGKLLPFLRILPAVMLFVMGASAAAQSVPPGFTVENYGGALSDGTALAWSPDARLFVGQRNGMVRIIKNGSLLPTPFHSTSVDMAGERGLLGLCLDPDFLSNGYVYIYFTNPSPASHNCVRRLQVSGPGSDVSDGSELPIVDLENLGADLMHMGGAIQFGGDGKLYVAVGDNADANHAQSLTSRFGKILRYNADGSIPGDNPPSISNISGSTSGEFRAIWAAGLRNPFRMAFQPGSVRLYINDVGLDTWEEINDGSAGANYGWVGGSTDGARNVAGMTDPIFQYGHTGPAPTGIAITGGVFYNPGSGQFPSLYVGRYFFADYGGGFIYALDGLGKAEAFLTGATGIVDLAIDPDGALYYLTLQGSPGVHRVSYGTSGDQTGTPVGDTPAPASGATGGGGCGLTGFEPALIFILAALLFRRR